MNTRQVHKAVKTLDLEFVMMPLDDMQVALELLVRNGHLIEDYPSLEEAVKLLKSVIERECEKTNRQEECKE